jgi:hypothetical protein
MTGVDIARAVLRVSGTADVELHLRLNSTVLFVVIGTSTMSLFLLRLVQHQVLGRICGTFLADRDAELSLAGARRPEVV